MAGQETGLTYHDLVGKFPEEDNVQRELIDGELVVTPSPSTRHQQVVGEVFVVLREFAGRTGGKAYVAPLDVYLSETNIVEPDAIYVGPEKVDPSETRFLRAVDLVVEVSSPSTRRLDLVRKRRLYERFRVPEYWFVDVEAGRIAAYSLEDARFASPVTAGRSETLRSPSFPGLEVVVDDIVGPPPTG